MPNTRTSVVYTMDNGQGIVLNVPTKYVTPGGFTAYSNQTVVPRPKGLRTRKATLRTHIPDSATGANDAHFLERKVPCQISALAPGTGALAVGATPITGLDYTGDTTSWVPQGWVGERKKNLK